MADMSPADMAAVMGHDENSMGGNSAWWWIIILFLFIFNGGNTFGMNGNGVGAEVQRGFDQNAVISSIGDLNNNVVTGFSNMQGAMCNGFAGINQNLCNGFAGVNANISNGFAQAEIANNARQIADMNQNFAMQTGITNQMNAIAMNQQSNCFENRQATADLKYTVADQACQNRTVVNESTNALLQALNAQTQSLKDQMYNDKLEAKNDLIAQLRSELMYARGQASQDVQTAAIQAGQRALANEVEQYVAPMARPAYLVQNPYCCNQSVYGCCGNA